jgi:Holliday junction DNA helicase RuvB
MSEHKDQRDALRPASLDDFTGQADAVAHLRIVLEAAKGRDEMPDHMLFSGPPGLGKTTLAGIIASELGVASLITSGPALEKPGDVAALLSSIREPSVVFIDEVHRMPRIAEEILYPAMEDRVLDFIVGDGVKARTVRLALKPLCIVGATTQAGLLSAPFRDRFGFQARLDLYNTSDMVRIIQRSAGLLGFNVDEEGATSIALRSRGTPRVANTLLRRVRDWAQVNSVDSVDEKAAKSALDAFSIDELGLDKLGVEILRSLCVTFGGGPVGLNTIAAAVGESPVTISEVYEPYLMSRQLISRTSKGRVATPAAWAHLGLELPLSAVLQAAQQLPLTE